MTPRIDGSEELARGRFLAFRKLHYTDSRGRERVWEAVDRVRADDPGPSAVFIVARIVPEDEIVLIRQFRPPVGKPTIEFPAGLIDPGETPEATAVRELYEETGFTGKVLRVTNGGYSSPGLSGESIALAVMEIDGRTCPDGMIPPNHQEDTEDITVFRVKRAELDKFIAEMEAAGCGVDSKIYTVLAFQEPGA